MNDSTNDTAIRAILKHLQSDILDPDSRRVRCLGHITNLAVKAFLFSKDPDSFEANSRNKKERWILKLLESSRAHGSYRKFHNTIQFIRITPQRRDKWSEIANGTVEEDPECKLPINFSTFRCQDQTPRAWRLGNLSLCASMIIADNETRWNSAYLPMQRGLKLRGKIMQFLMITGTNSATT